MAALFFGGVVGAGRQVPWAPSCSLADFGPIAGFLTDPHGLGETGEVLVGVDDGDSIRLILPPGRRLASGRGGVRASFPSLSAAIAGRFGFMRTIDYRDQDVLVAYRPVGIGYPGWGLIAKIDSAEAYAPVDRLRWLLLALGGVALALGLGASNAIARRFARPIRRLARTSAAVAAGDLSVRSEVNSSDEIGALEPGVQPDDRGAGPLVRDPRAPDLRADPRPGSRPRPARRLLPDLDLAAGPGQHRQDVRFRTAVLLRLGYDLAMISLVDREAGVIRAVRRPAA